MGRLVSGLVAIAVVVGGGSGAARAEEKPKQALLLVEWMGPIEPGEKVDLMGTFAAAVSTHGYALVEDSPRDDMLAGDKRLAKCMDTIPCKFELAERLNADLVIVAMVARDPGGKGKKATKEQWKVSMTLLPLDVRRQGADGDRACKDCTEQQVGPMITSLVGETIASEKKKPRAMLAVHSKPTGAAVKLDSDDLGVTDFRHLIYAGPHGLEVSLGDQKAELQFEAEADKLSEFDADLATGKIEKRAAPVPIAEVPSITTPPPPPPKWMRPTGFAFLGAGVLAAGAGVAMLVIDGQGTCTLMGKQRQCPQVQDTLGLGIGLVAGGGAAVIAGAVLTYLGSRKGGEQKLTFAPLISPSVVGLGAFSTF